MAASCSSWLRAARGENRNASFRSLCAGLLGMLGISSTPAQETLLNLADADPTIKIIKIAAERNQDAGSGFRELLEQSKEWYSPGRDRHGKNMLDTRASFFSADNQIVGWTGVPLAEQLQFKKDRVNGVSYSAAIDATDLRVLAQYHEMAKQMRRKVTVYRKGAPNTGSDREGYVEEASFIVEADLPVYAITSNAVVAGRVKRVGFFGDLCSAEGMKSAAKFVFPAPLSEKPYAYFVSLKPIEVASTKVLLKKQEMLEDYYGGTRPSSKTVLTTFKVDLDGDGIADLKGGNQSQTEVDFQNSRAPAFETRIIKTTFGGWVLPVNGRYIASEPSWLLANIGGEWKEIARYGSVPCD